jgi:hypothetical protein
MSNRTDKENDCSHIRVKFKPSEQNEQMGRFPTKENNWTKTNFRLFNNSTICKNTLSNI